MTRPLLTDLAHDQQGWDADTNDNMDVIGSTPFPPASYTSTGALPSAGAYDGCVAAVDASGTFTLYMSDGTSWLRMVTSDGTDVNALIDNSGGTGGTDTIPAIVGISSAADAFAIVAEKVNSVIARLGLDLA